MVRGNTERYVDEKVLETALLFNITLILSLYNFIPMKIIQENIYLKKIQDIVRLNKTETYCVGGFLRDRLLNVVSYDFDFAVSKDALLLAQKVSQEIHGAYVLLDQDNGCARVVKKSKGHIYVFDFADFRRPTFKQDLECRDFTVNTFFVNFLELNVSVSEDIAWKELIQSNKQKKEDLNNKIVCMTNPEVFKEDPLRILRAFSLMAVLDFRIEKHTKDQIKKDSHLLRNISYERITGELFKILNSDNTYKVLTLMDEVEVLDKVIPQVSVMYGCDQGEYHHLDVWKHTLECIKQFDNLVCQIKEENIRMYLNDEIVFKRLRKGIIKLALLLHDIGKPDTKRKRPEGGFSFHGHENVGKRIVKHIAKLLKVSTCERRLLEDMVQMHLRPGYLSNSPQLNPRMLFRYLRDTKDEAVSIALLSIADQRSTRGELSTKESEKHHENICWQLVDTYFENKKKVPRVKLVSGHDLMREFDLKPSRILGNLLEGIDEAQALGDIKTRDEAFEFVRKTLLKKGC